MAHRLYDRRSDESAKAYEAFAMYRDMGVSRTLESVSAKLSKSVTLINRWSAAYCWVERVRAYDDYIEQQARKHIESNAIKRKADMLRRHTDTGKALQHKGLQYLQDHGIDRSSDAIAAVRIGVDIERKTEALPEWIFEIVNAQDNDLIRQYAELLTQIGSADSRDETSSDGDVTANDPSQPR